MKRDLRAIRGIDEDVYRRFREKTLQERMRVGYALTLAMNEWIKKEGKREKTTHPKNLFRIKPFDWGKGTEKTSKEIDEILYGSKR